MIKGVHLEVYLTSSGKNDQKPLDLNPPSTILLLTFFKIRTKLTIPLLLSILQELEMPKKVKYSYPRQSSMRSRTFMRYASSLTMNML